MNAKQNPFVEQLQEIKEQLSKPVKKERAPQKRLTAKMDRQFKRDVVSGMSAEEIMEKWGISKSGYYSIRKRLGLITPKKRVDIDLSPNELMVRLGMDDRNIEFLQGYSMVFGKSVGDILRDLVTQEERRILGKDKNPESLNF